MVFLRARYYDPVVGRFLTRDPWPGESLEPRSLFPSYQYADSNPINKTDPSGMTPLPPSNGCPINCHLTRSKDNNGYSESVVSSVIFGNPQWLKGTEIVYDFATLQIAEFGVHVDIDPHEVLNIDIGLISLEKVYDVSYISGFEPEPRGDIVEEYGPHTVNISFGVSVGVLASVQLGLHKWFADDLSLTGQGVWYGGEVSIFDLGMLAATSGIAPGSPEFSYYKTFTSYRFRDDLGDVCNPEEAQMFLEVLEKWPYPALQYIGLLPFRNKAIKNFKAYAGID